MTIVFEFVLVLLQIYYYLLIATILLSWFPELRQSNWYRSLVQLTQPYLRIFRGLLVFGQLDFTPILGFLLYQFGLAAFEAFVNSL